MIIQGTPEWFAQRIGKATASQISNVMMKPTLAGYQNYRAQLVCERLTGEVAETFKSAAMQHGNDTEPQARAFYELETCLTVHEVAFIDHPTIEMSGASPDGLVGDDGLVEIKCPQPATHIKTLTGSKIARNYMLQMQWQLSCTGRAWCDFVSFCPSMPSEMQINIQRVLRDPALIVEISEAVKEFMAGVDAVCADLNSKFPSE